MTKVALVLLFALVACSDIDPVLGSAEFSDANPSAEVDLSRHEGPTLGIPLNSLWTIHTVSRAGCDTAPLPTRMQFGHSGVLFMVFSSGYSDQTEWSQLDGYRVITGERRVFQDVTLEAAIWHVDGASLRAIVHYFGESDCTADLVAILEVE